MPSPSATSPISWACIVASRTARSVFPLLLAAELAASPPLPADARLRLSLPAQPADRAVSALAVAAGISVGWDRSPPDLRLPALQGRMTVREALRRLLEGSGFRAVRVGATAWRIVHAGAPDGPAGGRRPGREPGGVLPDPAPPPDIVVTAQKRREPLATVAGSVSVVRPEALSSGAAAGSADVARAIDGLAVTNLGPSRNRQFIRGVADSPFNGSSQSTVAVVIDEARATFDAPDPDIRLVDVDRVEVLKGPQGPLYGSGALGGIYHVVTRPPDTAELAGFLSAEATAVGRGGVGGGVDAMLNVPLVTDRLAFRGVAYAIRDAGWIDDAGLRSDANSTVTKGARAALRWEAAPGWSLQMSGIAQAVNARDSQYVTGPEDALRRRVDMPEPADNDYRSVAATVEGRLGGIDLLGTASVVGQGVDYVQDATSMAGAFGLSGVVRFQDGRRYGLVNGEVRLSSGGRRGWLAGVSVMRASSREVATVAAGDVLDVVRRRDRTVDEVSAFGELSLPIGPAVTALAGARLSRSAERDGATEGPAGQREDDVRLLLAPSVSLRWSVGDGLSAYARYARAVRPGGLAGGRGDGSARFDSDALDTLDVGLRRTDQSGRLSGALSGYYSRWTDIQSDFLLPDGLFSTRNAGEGRILGAEASAEWSPAARFSVSGGVSYVDAHLVRSAAGLELDDRRLPVTPDLTLRGTLRRRFGWRDWTAVAYAEAIYSGRARLSFDPTLDRRMGGYATGAVGLDLGHGPWSASLRLDNPLDARGDTFAFGNQFSIATAMQRTPLRPRSLTLGLGRRW